MDKELHYQKILRTQKQAFWFFLSMPFLLVLSGSLFGERGATFLFAADVVIAYCFSFRVLGVDICPWCGHSFLRKHQYGRPAILNMPIIKCCVNCGAPCSGIENPP